MKIFCAGIGGIGLSAYAAYQHACGHDVTGSDRAPSALTDDLLSQGIAVTTVQDENALAEDTDLLVYSLALPDSHPLRQRAYLLGIPQQSYFEALGALVSASGKKLIAVCGTHGKSSTTAMAAHLLLASGVDASVILGTKIADLGGRNWHVGTGEYFLVEACEYRRSFLHLQPSIVLLTNVTGDHFDVFTDMNEYQEAFGSFLVKLPSEGTLITHGEREDCMQLAGDCSCQVRDADRHALPQLSVPGEHMRQNGRLVLELADLLGIPDAGEVLGTYAGCWRRTEYKGTMKRGTIVIDDYGHHPNEIRATLEGLQSAYPEKRIVCVFQPHTHDRVLKLYDQFVTAFTAANVLIIPNVYDARPKLDTEKVSMPDFIEAIAQGSHCSVRDGVSLDATVTMLLGMLETNDVLVTIGAGDVWQIADRMIGE